MIKSIDDIIDLMSQYAAPYLFIGSGFSRRYIGTPDWETLLRLIADNYDINLNKLMLECRKGQNAFEINYPKLGSLLNAQLEQIFVEQDSKFDFRKTTAIKNEITNLLMEVHEKCDLDNEEVIAFKCLLEKASGIITTNYDLLLEHLTAELDFESYIGQSSLISKNLSFADEIYKIHGCVSDRESIVITEEDYRKFENRQKYILGKLTVIFAEFPLIFIGYSLEDINIKSILKDLMTSLTYEELKQISQKWLFIEYCEGEQDLVPKEHVIEIEDGSRLIFNCIQTDNYIDLYEKLSHLSFKLPPQRKVIKYIKKMIHEYEIRPNSTLYVQDSDDIEAVFEAFKLGENVAINFGKTTVFMTINPYNVMQDTVLDNISEYSTKTAGFAENFKRNMGGVYYPRYKYFTLEELHQHGIPIIELSSMNLIYNKSLDDSYKTSDDINYQIQYWIKEVDQNPQNVNVDEMRGFLATIFDGKSSIKQIKEAFNLKNESNLRKLVTAYDILQFKK